MNSMTKTILAAIAIVAAIALLHVLLRGGPDAQRRWCCASATSTAWSTKPGLYFKVPFADTVT